MCLHKEMNSQGKKESIFSLFKKPVSNKLCYVALCFCIVLFFIYCNSTFTPKPKGFYTIQLPEKKYQTFNQQQYPYTFQYPVYGHVVKDSLFFGEVTENPWWINIQFPSLNGKIFISYKEVGKNSLQKLITDAYTLTNKHTIKATSKEDSLITTTNGVHGVFFRVYGDVATQYQFLLTDSVKHFVRGALYLEATPNSDSTKPVHDFLLRDMFHFINTFKWK